MAKAKKQPFNVSDFSARCGSSGRVHQTDGSSFRRSSSVQ